jgi:hypothetical protein
MINKIFQDLNIEGVCVSISQWHPDLYQLDQTTLTHYSEHKLYLWPMMCEFEKTQIEYLGIIIIMHNKLKMDLVIRPIHTLRTYSDAIQVILMSCAQSQQPLPIFNDFCLFSMTSNHWQQLILNDDDYMHLMPTSLYPSTSKPGDLSLSPMQPPFPCPWVFDMLYSYLRSLLRSSPSYYLAHLQGIVSCIWFASLMLASCHCITYLFPL